MKVSFFERRPQKNHHSIEGLFRTIKDNLNPLVQVNSFISEHFSIGLLNRIRIGLAARVNQGDVNHITGDIHFLVLFLAGKKTVLTIHDCHQVSERKGLINYVYWLFWFYFPIKKAQIITVISKATKAELLRTVSTDPQKIKVIYNCIHPIFRPATKEFNKEIPTILQIGTAENKNLKRLIQAVKNLNCKLIIVGDINSEIQAMLNRYNINYSNKTGLTTNELYQQYCDSDIVAFVSTYEGFGLPIIEANATGRPVITSNLSSMPEVAGNAALLVDPLSVHSIREGIIQIIQDENFRNNLIDKGFDNLKRFEPSKIAHEYHNVYMQVFRESKR